MPLPALAAGVPRGVRSSPCGRAIVRPRAPSASRGAMRVVRCASRGCGALRARAAGGLRAPPRGGFPRRARRGGRIGVPPDGAALPARAGVRVDIPSADSALDGSCPRTREAPLHPYCEPDVFRFIPACAGTGRPGPALRSTAIGSFPRAREGAASHRGVDVDLLGYQQRRGGASGCWPSTAWLLITTSSRWPVTSAAARIACSRCPRVTALHALFAREESGNPNSICSLPRLPSREWGCRRPGPVRCTLPGTSSSAVVRVRSPRRATDDDGGSVRQVQCGVAQDVFEAAEGRQVLGGAARNESRTVVELPELAAGAAGTCPGGFRGR